MAGCTRWQLLSKVRFPAAAATLLPGLNQVIMQTLAMVVIASLIGASGLGHGLLIALISLKLGTALELGAAIVVLAVALDRLSLAAWRYDPYKRGEQKRRRGILLLGVVLCVATVAVATLCRWATPLSGGLYSDFSTILGCCRHLRFGRVV
ncbi:ABC transporter permease subunit [Ruegeria marisflavi]|uniref:ABC transporter permease subunit n=1 Tax=Ruegeria marisflavi TaxID=2984152 RepID=UPI0037C91C30